MLPTSLRLQDPGDHSVNKLRGVVCVDNMLLRGAKYAQGCLQPLATISGLAMPAENSLNGRKLEVVKIPEDQETRVEAALPSSLVCLCSAGPLR